MDQRRRWRTYVTVAPQLVRHRAPRQDGPAPKLPPWSRWLMVLALIPIGLGTIATCWRVVDLLVLKARGVTTMATVTQYEPARGWYKSEQPSRATVEYVDQQGQEWSVEIENVPEATVGQLVRIIYDPRNPWVVRDRHLSSGPIDFLFAAVMLLIATTLLSGALTGRPSSPRRRPVYLLLGVLGVAVWFLATLVFG
jgi:Protein of unknown function (DUF3592)